MLYCRQWGTLSVVRWAGILLLSLIRKNIILVWRIKFIFWSSPALKQHFIIFCCCYYFRVEAFKPCKFILHVCGGFFLNCHLSPTYNHLANESPLQSCLNQYRAEVGEDTITYRSISSETIYAITNETVCAVTLLYWNQKPHLSILQPSRTADDFDSCNKLCFIL